MKRLPLCACLLLALAAPIPGHMVFGTPNVAANECSPGSLRGNILSGRDRAKLTLRRSSFQCRSPSLSSSKSAIGPVFTFEVVCDPNSDQGPGTLCSVAPCLQANQSFALRNIRFPDGRVDPAGFQCLDPTQAEAAPGLTFAQIDAAIREVKLPGGRIHRAPATRGLANLSSFFWVEGVAQEPVALSIAGSVLHAEFRVVEYRWNFGGGRSLVTTGPGTPGLRSEVSTTFPRRGMYPIGVTVIEGADDLPGGGVADGADWVRRVPRLACLG